ncbi:MAG: tautomerase family protein [Sneathiella sp.]
MPFISLRIAKSEISDDQAAALIEQTTTLMTDIMKKKAERVSIQIALEDPRFWSVGRNRLIHMDRCGARMDIDVTAGTNTIEEKEDMVAASTTMLDDILGIDFEMTYIVINEIPGESWGKGGIMLADRAKVDRLAQRGI